MPADLPVAAALTTAPGPVLATQLVLPSAEKALGMQANFAGQLAAALTVVGQNSATVAQPTIVQPAVVQPTNAKAMPTALAPADAAANAGMIASPTAVVLAVNTTGPAEPAEPGEPAEPVDRVRPTQPARRSANAPGEAAPAGPQLANLAPLAAQQATPSVPVPLQVPVSVPVPPTGPASALPAPATLQVRLRAMMSEPVRAEPPQRGVTEPTAQGVNPAEPAVTGPGLPEPVGHAAATPPPALVGPAPTVPSEPTAGILPITTDVLPAAPPAPTASSQPAPVAASPAAQLAPALVSLAHAPDGAQRLTLRLDPPELGQVHVRIDRLPDAPARVEITVQRPETLTLLLRDQPQLQRALDQAGVPADGRSVTFHVAQAEPGTRPDAGPTFNPSTSSAGQAGGDGSHAAYRQANGQPRQDSGTADDADAEFVPVPLPSWVRAGVDITA